MGALEPPVNSWEGVWAPEQAATQFCSTRQSQEGAPHPTPISAPGTARGWDLASLTCALTFLDDSLLLISRVSGGGQTTQCL